MPCKFKVMKVVGVVYMAIGVTFIGAHDKLCCIGHGIIIRKSTARNKSVNGHLPVYQLGNTSQLWYHLSVIIYLGGIMVVYNADVIKKDLFPGASRKVLARGGGLMLVEVLFDAGSVVDAHAHPHEQVSYVVSGKIVLSMDGRDLTLGTGDSFYAGPNVLHGVRFLENSVVIDAFTPQREDFIK